MWCGKWRRRKLELLQRSLNLLRRCTARINFDRRCCIYSQASWRKNIMPSAPNIRSSLVIRLGWSLVRLLLLYPYSFFMLLIDRLPLGSIFVMFLWKTTNNLRAACSPRLHKEDNSRNGRHKMENGFCIIFIATSWHGHLSHMHLVRKSFEIDSSKETQVDL